MNPADPAPEERRPRDLALLLLALGDDPPRQRARDQQADRAGASLRRRLLDGLAALDPEPGDCESALEAAVVEIGEPTGPTRAVAALILSDWRDARTNPGLWSWLLSEALEASVRPPGRRRGGGRWPSTE
jgi:hypothetical protein